MRARARARGLEITVDSAGTSDWHIGDPPYGPMIEAASAAGYDLSSLRARQVKPQDFEEFELIIGMDAANIERLEAIRPAGNTTPVKRLLEYANAVGGTHDVPDPYYTRDFAGALELIENGADGLFDQLEQ